MNGKILELRKRKDELVIKRGNIMTELIEIGQELKLEESKAFLGKAFRGIYKSSINVTGIRNKLDSFDDEDYETYFKVTRIDEVGNLFCTGIAIGNFHRDKMFIMRNIRVDSGYIDTEIPVDVFDAMLKKAFENMAKE